MLQALSGEPLDGGSEHFQPSELVITSVDVGNPASNVIPGRGAGDLQRPLQRPAHGAHARGAAARPARHGGRRLSARDQRAAPSRSSPRPGAFTELLEALIERELGVVPELSTSGGTSDARFIKDVCPVVEFGLVGRDDPPGERAGRRRRPRGVDPGVPGPARELRQSSLMPDREEVAERAVRRLPARLVRRYRHGALQPDGRRLLALVLRRGPGGARPMRCWSVCRWRPGRRRSIRACSCSPRASATSSPGRLSRWSRSC